MPSPSSSLATLRPDLAASYAEFNLEMDRRGFIGSRVLPFTDVAKASGKFGKIPIEQLLQLAGDISRAPGAGYQRGEWTFTDASFNCIEYGFEEPVDDNESALYNEYFDVEQISAMRALDRVLRAYETRVANAVFNTTTWTGAALTTAITTEWSTITATPIADVAAARQKVYDGSGMWPNAMVVNQKVVNNLKKVTEIIDLIKYSGFHNPTGGAIGPTVLAEVFDLDFILVAGGSNNTAIEGQAATLASIWDDEYAMICKIPQTADFREPGIGRTFHWPEDGSSQDVTVESYRDETARSDVIRARHQVDEVIIHAETGHLLSNVTA